MSMCNMKERSKLLMRIRDRIVAADETREYANLYHEFQNPSYT